jgi:hypothetical protein
MKAEYELGTYIQQSQINNIIDNISVFNDIIWKLFW